MDSIEDVVDMAAEENAEQQGDFGGFMSSIEQSMLQMMKETAKAPETAYEHWQAFSTAVNWSETWIRCLISFHLILFTVVILSRKSETTQCVLFMIVCVLAFMSERLNTFCSENWTQFSTQNYFDQHGVFAGIMYSGPLLFIGLVQLINFLALSSSALIKAKKLELAHKIKSGKKATTTGEEGNKQESASDKEAKTLKTS